MKTQWEIRYRQFKRGRRSERTMKIPAKTQSRAERLFLRGVPGSQVEIISVIPVEMMPNSNCRICRCKLTPKNVARYPREPWEERSGQIRLDGNGLAWCRRCTKRHDSIDWDEVTNERLAMG